MATHPLEKLANHKFADAELLKQALTHKSYACEHKPSVYNERLEFLGDSVLGLVAAHFVFSEDAKCPEGKLAKRKSMLVSKPYLAKWAGELSLGDYLFLGQGEETTGGRQRDTILADALEAFIGALYLDGGLEKAKGFILTRFSAHPLDGHQPDFKSVLQEITQKKYKNPPKYEILSSAGPEHAKVFAVEVFAGGKKIGTGKGKNKKEAQQNAAQDALSRIDGK